MTINDKLRHFYEITIAEAEKKANAGLDEHKKMLKEKINEHKRTMYRNAEAEVRSETEHASKEINIALANEKLTLRRLLSSRQTELEDRLFQKRSTKPSSLRERTISTSLSPKEMPAGSPLSSKGPGSLSRSLTPRSSGGSRPGSRSGTS